MQKTEHVLYWEDVNEPVLYAELDDYSWKLPEKIFGYRKRSSFYIYHDRRLAAFYHPDDIAEEARVGFAFFGDDTNIERVIGMKRAVAEKVRRYGEITTDDIAAMSDANLRARLLETIDLYHEALSTHYLTQPQFFEEFERDEARRDEYHARFADLAKARFEYTRRAWTHAKRISEPLLAEYARRRGISAEEAGAMTHEELSHGDVRKEVLASRAEKFVLVSEYHSITVQIEVIVDEYISTYEDYRGIESVTGLTGNKGSARGRAFVVSNENLDLKRLPAGMQSGMILIVQNAWPEFQPYYEQAAAIVTNEGGITSHGAVVARELGVPCVVGTKIATHVFANGDMVEVDADNGVVRVVERAGVK